MRSLIIAALLLGSSAFVYAQDQDVTVRGNTKLNTDFSKYKTYTWAQLDKVIPTEGEYEIYSYSEEIVPSKSSKPGQDKKTKTVTRNSKVKSGTEPYVYSYSVIIPASDVAVNSTIQASIAEELEGRGYRRSDNNSDLMVSYKVLSKGGKMRGFVNDVPTVVNQTEVREPRDTATYFLKPGTLLINLIDAKNSQVVWDGFASGLIQGEDFVTDPVKLEEAIHLIFNEFKFRADQIKAAK